MKTHALAQIPDPKPTEGPVVRLSNVVKTYKAGDVEVPAIKGISFDIPRQRFWQRQDNIAQSHWLH